MERPDGLYSLLLSGNGDVLSMRLYDSENGLERQLSAEVRKTMDPGSLRKVISGRSAVVEDEVADLDLPNVVCVRAYRRLARLVDSRKMIHRLRTLEDDCPPQCALGGSDPGFANERQLYVTALSVNLTLDLGVVSVLTQSVEIYFEDVVEYFGR